jgi:hypothetical protein
MRITVRVHTLYVRKMVSRIMLVFETCAMNKYVVLCLVPEEDFLMCTSQFALLSVGFGLCLFPLQMPASLSCRCVACDWLTLLAPFL